VTLDPPKKVSPVYTLSVDPARNLVMLKLIGLLTPAEVVQMYADEYKALEDMGCPVGEHRVLVDLTECGIQLKDVGEALIKTVKSSSSAHKIALFMPSALGRMQARRFSSSQNAIRRPKRKPGFSKMPDQC
jgi:hypothetical protein